MRRFASNHDGLPPHTVILPKFHVFDEFILVRFEGSARAFEGDLDELGVALLYDNIGLAPANLVPRWRSFPRNALTYAGVCAAVLPFALFLAWSAEGRRKLLGRIGVFACLLGAGFAIARGAWVAILVGIVYLLVDGLVSRRLKTQAVLAYVGTALLLTGLFFVLYKSDPLTARATGESSILTRQELYSDTVASVNEGVHLFLGYGTELPRLETGTTQAFGSYGKYVPRAGSHSTYLNYLFRAGIVGALLIAAVYVAAWLHARRAAKERSGSERTFSTLAATATVIVTAHAVILSLFVEPVYTLAVSLVLGLAMAGTTQLNGSVLPWRARS
jgi:O-antigen ligase